MAKKTKYPTRVVLAEGYPWALGFKPPYFELAMNKNPTGVAKLPLNYPDVLWDKDLPKYRLVLEKVK